MATKKEQEIKKGEERLENVESALSKTELWIEEHQKLIYGVIAAILILAGIIWGVKALNDKKNANASKEIFTAQKYFEKEMYEEAIDYLKKFNGNDEILAPMALGAIGDCYMELDDMNSAVSYYEKAANKSKNEFTGPLFLNKAAMTYEIMGNYAEALKCYKALKADYPLSNEAYEVSKNIANMEEKLK